MDENAEKDEYGPEFYVSDEEGKKHLIGKNNSRKKLYNKAQKQITKSCHVCQDQHVQFKCRASEKCSYSFCERCVAKYHASLSLRDLVEKCPVCRGVCSCRQCLRKMFQPKLELAQNRSDNRKHAEWILRCGGPFISQILQHYDEAAREFDKRLEDVGIRRSLDAFVTCDHCSTSIPDLHMCCWDCAQSGEEGKELCMECVLECRALGQEVFQNMVTCGTCRGPLTLTRMLSDAMLESLRQISQIYGSQKDHAVVPVFTYPFTKEGNAQIEVDLKCMPCGRVKLLCIVKRPPDMQLFLRKLADKSKRATREFEDQVQSLTSIIEWRDAGHGNRVCCIDALHCTKREVDVVLRLCIWKGEPLIIKNCRGIMDWRPQTMCRVFADRRNRYKLSKKRRHSRMDESSDDDSCEKANIVGPDDVCVVQCAPNCPMEYWRQCDFFRVYEKGQDSDMYRIKDWPPDATFREKLTRHYQDFVEMLPFQSYTNPVSGMLNMTTALPEYRCRPDIGPKTYLGTGRAEERNDGTDSVTHLHLDMTDAFNILLHAQEKSQNESRDCAAVWTIVGRKDVATVTEYLRNPDAICERKTYLRAVDREILISQHRAHLWTFDQFENDAVYVPSGCPHQVAIDFFPPESSAVVMKLVQYRRQFAKRVKNDREKDVVDGLQARATLMYACSEAYKVKQRQIDEFAVVDEKKARKWKAVEQNHIPSKDDMDLD